VFLPHGNEILLSYYDKIKILDYSDGSVLYELQQNQDLGVVTTNPTGTLIAASNDNGYV